MNLKKLLSVLAAAAIMLSVIPINGSAVELNTGTILTSIGHKSTNTISISGSTRSITLTADYNAPNTINLSDGLSITWGSEYTAVIPSFESGSNVVVGGSEIVMTVSFRREDDNTNTQYSTEYRISVIKGEYAVPEFNGTIEKSLTMPDSSVKFTDADFTPCYTKNSGTDITFISISGVNPDFGALKLSNSNYTFGSKISVSDISKLTFAVLETTVTRTVYYSVTAYTGTNAQNATPAKGSAELAISIVAFPIPEINSDIVKTIPLSGTCTFSASDFSTCTSYTGTLANIEITPVDSNGGTWYYGSTAFITKREIAVTSIGNLSFKAKSSGDATFKWRISNKEAGYSSTSGTGTITSERSDGTIEYSARENDIVKFALNDFETACFGATEETLSYVTFKLPATSEGRLYYNYSSATQFEYTVEENTKFYKASSPYINRISFVPASGYKGTAIIEYTACTTLNKTYTGKININIRESSVDIMYIEAFKGEPIGFMSSEFDIICYNVLRRNLSYVTFSIPSSTYGVLYYKYASSSNYDSKVTAGSRYYSNSTPYLSDITFAPNPSYTGMVTLEYTAYDNYDSSFKGYIEINISSGSSNFIAYTIERGQSVSFDARDFEKVCYDKTNRALDYVTFSLPSSTQGALYYRGSSTSNDTRVSSSNRYYYNSSPGIYNVSFVPSSGYSGTVTIDYKAYPVNGSSFSGKIRIIVNRVLDVNVLKYYVMDGEPLEFNSRDFDNVSGNLGYGRLDHIKFTTVPSSKTAGALYSDYDLSSKKGKSVSANKPVYYNRNTAPYIDSVSFVPSAAFKGSLTLSYTGCDVVGNTYMGTVEIISRQTAEPIKLLTGLNKPVILSSADINAACKQVTGNDLDYVMFMQQLRYGLYNLNYNFRSEFDVGSSVAYGYLEDVDGNYSVPYYRSQEPYLSSVAIIPAVDRSGLLTIEYLGYDTDGNAFIGEINLTVNTSGSASKYFTDVESSHSWAANEIDYLFDKGIIHGTGNDTYIPNADIKRGDFLLMLHRALDFAPRYSGGFNDVPADSYYYEAITTARALNIALGDGVNFQPESPLSRQDAMVLIYRALEAAGRPITAGVSKDISSYSDKGLVEKYATIPVASLVKADIIKGVNGTLRPAHPLTRAEMAVILFRALV